MLLTNILTLAGGALMFGSKYAKSYELLIVGRFLIGINSGRDRDTCFQQDVQNTSMFPYFPTRSAE